MIPVPVRIFKHCAGINILYLYFMTQIVIDKKKYVLVPEKEFLALQKKAALKTKPEKLFSVEQARSYSKKLIQKWAAEK